jgi:hypothetical protein
MVVTFPEPSARYLPAEPHYLARRRANIGPRLDAVGNNQRE